MLNHFFDLYSREMFSCDFADGSFQHLIDSELSRCAARTLNRARLWSGEVSSFLLRKALWLPGVP